MKSRYEYYSAYKMFLTLALTLDCLALFLLDLCLFVRGGYATIFVFMSVALMFAILCHILAHRNKEFLFCPKCGSKEIVRRGLFGVPLEITDECPDCHQKINLDKSIRRD